MTQKELIDFCDVQELECRDSCPYWKGCGRYDKYSDATSGCDNAFEWECRYSCPYWDECKRYEEKYNTVPYLDKECPERYTDEEI